MENRWCMSSFHVFFITCVRFLLNCHAIKYLYPTFSSAFDEFYKLVYYLVYQIDLLNGEG